ncbi:cytochrome c oxidase assembly factor Coa1 family protein [Coraliomargarita sp. W4R53]
MNESENTSGTGKMAEIPQEIKGWNWGAFFLNFFWGIGNSSYFALLMCVPFVNFFVPFILGAKGNQWAWQNRRWIDVQHFKRTQRKWGITGFLLVGVGFPAFFLLIMSTLKGEAFELAVKEIKNNAEIVERIGTDIEPSFFVMGEMSTSGSDGIANLSFSLTGNQSSAKAAVYAQKSLSEWHLKEVIVYNNDEGWSVPVVTHHQIESNYSE